MSKQERNQLKMVAEEYKALYKRGDVSREIAKEKIMPFIDSFNEKSKEIAKKYGMRPKTITFAKWVR